jgi:hypothetical protein
MDDKDEMAIMKMVLEVNMEMLVLKFLVFVKDLYHYENVLVLLYLLLLLFEYILMFHYFQQ